MACSHQQLLFDYLSRRGLLLFLVLSAAAGEMDHKIAGDRFIMCPAGCVPELHGGSHINLFERLAEQNGNKLVVVEPDVPAGGAGRLALRPHHDRQQHIDRNDGHPASSPPAGDGAVGVVRSPTLPVDTPTYAGVHRRRPHPRHFSVRSPCIDTSAGWWARTSYQLLPAVIIRSSSDGTSGSAAGRSHLHIVTALSELNSENNLQIQSSVADRLISLMIMAIMAMGGGRANERRKRTCCSAAVLTMLLVAAAFAESAMAARPLPADATAGGHDEASASTTPGMPLNEAAAGHSSCTTDPNTQEPVRCIHH